MTIICSESNPKGDRGAEMKAVSVTGALRENICGDAVWCPANCGEVFGMLHLQEC